MLYADDLVFMAPTMEQLGRRVADWRASLLGKGLKMNAGKSKVMVGSSGGKMIVNSGKWPCGVCGKGVQANSVQCTICKKIIHKRCSGVHGDLSLVADDFRCRRCDGTILEVEEVEKLRGLMNGILNGADIPKEWKESRVNLLHKGERRMN